ncbi:Bifunctional uridylyltransferase/uridylyl-removing enzyme [Posidoniimonas polymericola]|uniref:Bifunctional uridylyltransferase/uridylyl-removing enzyme n=1 Tax=Posidoniimonas polymericola TaxID=2528002 RepID=A0A5C5YRX8_9BACT|nr:[protein-PII] uridylyltransferase [Posidoniimonas polymericola]TWT77659.1 Bifunctional uridylyltransferase/uridylyl-removing enzyme [Posidoniimonas polymericola]
MPPDSSPAPRLRQELIEAREQLAAGRDAIRKQHDLGMPGVQVGRKLTALADAALQRVAESALADFPRPVADRLRERAVLVAHGGYGRRQMAPFSDVDVMLLHQGRVDRDVERFARRITQDVFDIGLQLGQSLRTVDESIRLARQDAVIASSLVESRPLIGSEPVMDEFRDKFRRMIGRRVTAQCADFIEARRAERDKYGETVYLLEPNVKRSPGALRDLHFLRWLWFAHAGESDLERLRMRGVISKFDHRRLVTARDFLMRVRNELHFHAGQERDLLIRVEQVRIAEKFEYYGSAGLLPVERFMRDYFRHAGHVSFLANRMTELSAPKPTVERVFDSVFTRRVEADYQLGTREISATQQGRAKLERHAGEALHLLDLARVSDLRVAQDTNYLVYRSAPNYSNEVTPERTRQFLDVLENPHSLGWLLRRAHELGVLEKFLPEFGRARCLLQFNQYHKYTVDEHSIRAVEEATRLLDQRSRVGSVYAAFDRKWLLHLALLIHDLGKGQEEDHSIVGERIAGETAERFGLSASDRDTLMFLIREHLSMNRIALRRDISNPDTIRAFANLTQTTERLTLLYLLTTADMCAVGPEVMTKWKADMLGSLYTRTLWLLQPDEDDPSTRRAARRAASWQALSKQQQGDPWFKRQLDAMPESFFASHQPREVVDTLSRLRSLTDGRGAAWGSYQSSLGAVEYLAGVHSGSGRGVFSSMAGALSAAGLKINQAETAMLSDDLLLLRYVAQDPDAPTGAAPERIFQISRAMERSIDSDAPPKFRRVWGAEAAQSQAALSNQPPEVRLDASLTNRWLIVEVFTIDRLGLLYELARALHELGLVIGFAKIGTSGDRVVDVFYVSERDESKPESDHRLQEIRARLEQVIGASDS